MRKNVVLIAPPGAGKGSLARELNDVYGMVQISTGDMLRVAIAKGDPLGLEVKTLIDQGSFVPDNLIFDILDVRLKEEDSSNGFIFDGFPRSLDQAINYDSRNKGTNMEVDLACLLEISKEKLLSRILGRRICPKCGHIYNIYDEDLNSKQDGICDYCETPLYKRDDDNEASFEKRYKTYREVTEPLVDYYKQQNKLIVVDADKETKATLDDLSKFLEKYND